MSRDSDSFSWYRPRLFAWVSFPLIALAMVGTGGRHAAGQDGRPALVAGTVRDAAGRSVAEATVWIVVNPAAPLGRFEKQAETRSRTGGVFSFPELSIADLVGVPRLIAIDAQG